MVLSTLLCIALTAGAKAPKIDLGIKVGADIPKGESLKRVPEAQATTEPSATASQVEYSVVRVTHGKGFIRSPEGSRPSAPMDVVSASGTPLKLEKFSTVVRVKCTQNVNAPIDVVIVDERGDTLMEASGELMFRAQKQPELDYQVDWESTPVRRVADLAVLVRVAGRPLGTWPIKVAEKK